jgi:hypothetical protein
MVSVFAVLWLAGGCAPWRRPPVPADHPAGAGREFGAVIPAPPRVLEVEHADHRDPADHRGVPLHPDMPEMKHHEQDSTHH